MGDLRVACGCAIAFVTACWGSARVAGPSPKGLRLWVAPASVYADSVWFASELEPIADAVAAKLAREGYDVVPTAEVRALWADARAGTLPGVARCEVPAPPRELTDAVYANSLTAVPEVLCKNDACKLTVIVWEHAAKDYEIARYTLALRGHAPAAWAMEIRAGAWQPALPPEVDSVPPLGSWGIIGGTGNGARGPYVLVGGVTLAGAWAGSDAITDATFQPEAARLAACQRPDQVWRDDGGEQRFVIEVDERGAVRRCEYAYQDRLAPPWLACECEVIERMAFGAAPTPRRAAFDLLANTPGGDSPIASVTLEKLDATDHSALSGTHLVDEYALAACVEHAAERATSSESYDDGIRTLATLRVSFDVGADGRVTGHALDALPPTLAAAKTCLDGVLARARFSCPLTGRAHVTGLLHIER